MEDGGSLACMLGCVKPTEAWAMRPKKDRLDEKPCGALILQPDCPACTCRAIIVEIHRPDGSYWFRGSSRHILQRVTGWCEVTGRAELARFGSVGEASDEVSSQCRVRPLQRPRVTGGCVRP